MTMRRQTQWFTREQINSAVGSGVSDNLTLTSAGVHNTFRQGMTVTRMIIDLVLAADTLAQRNRFYWGICVVNAAARAGGAMPDPSDVTERPSWLVRGRMEVIQNSLSDASQWTRTLLDLRSQRVLRSEDDELQLLIKNGATGFGAEWSAFIRVLVKMPL